MLATQLNSLIKNNAVTNTCIVRLNEFICNTVHNRRYFFRFLANHSRIVIILNLEVISPPVPTIGNPVNIEQALGGLNQLQNLQPQHSVPPQNMAMAAKPQPYQPVKPAQVKAQGVAHQKGAPQQQYGFNNMQQVDMGSNIYPIKSLNPYQNRWTIKARVTSKSDVKTWSNARGNGKLVSFDLLDNSVLISLLKCLTVNQGEIRATMFNETVEKFASLLEVGKVLIYFAQFV
jgi:replication factor A1